MKCLEINHIGNVISLMKKTTRTYYKNTKFIVITYTYLTLVYFAAYLGFKKKLYILVFLKKVTMAERACCSSLYVLSTLQIVVEAAVSLLSLDFV